MEKNESTNKNAFQWDAYRPPVDCIPAWTAQGVSERGCLPRRMSTQGVGCLPGGGVYPSMH